MKPQPALVYTVPDSRDEMDEYLLEHDLYRYDDLSDAADEISKPSAERPILRKNMLYANIAGNQTRDTDDEIVVPHVFVTDHLSTLGPDRKSQTAVVGALMSCGMRVHADYRELESGWYFSQVQELGFPGVGQVVASMLEIDFSAEMMEYWKLLTPGGAWLLSTSWHRGPEEARQRVQELVDGANMSFTQAGRQLTVEGYHNKNGRIRWYTKAVREVYEAGA